LQAAGNLVCERLKIPIREEGATKHAPTWALSLLVHLDPNPFRDNIELGFSWIPEILNSGYSGRECLEVASKVVRPLGQDFYSRDFHTGVRSAWIPPLLAFLSLSEKFYFIVSPPYP